MKPRNYHAKHCPKKGGAHKDRKRESKRNPRRIPLWCSPKDWREA